MIFYYALGVNIIEDKRLFLQFLKIDFTIDADNYIPISMKHLSIIT